MRLIILRRHFLNKISVGAGPVSALKTNYNLKGADTGPTPTILI